MYEIIDCQCILLYYDGKKIYEREGIAVRSVISKTIDTSDQEAQYDACVKRLMSQKIILAWILKECVSEFKHYAIPQIMQNCIEGEPGVAVMAVDQDELDGAEDLAGSDSVIQGMNTEDVSIKEGKVYYDIRFSAIVPDTKEPVQLIINVEAQKSDKTSYPLIKRAIYYVSRMISAQKNTIFVRSHYEKIRKVYSIWIQMNVDEEKTNTITRYRISEEQVIGDVSEKERNYDLLTVIMLRLGSADRAMDKPILRLLDILLSVETRPEEKRKILEKDFDIPMSTAMSEEANVMCNLGEGIRERTAIETAASIIMNIMRNKKVTFDDAFASIFMPEEDKEDIKAYVDKQFVLK